MIYFDNAATTYPKPEVVYEAINFGMRQFSFNAGRGSYQEAKKTFDMIADTRNKIASLVNEDGNKVIFTSSATEALNNILYGLNLTSHDCVLVSPFEHNAVLRTLQNIGVSIVLIPFNKDTWDVDEDELNDLIILKKPKAVAISHISNVTGFELPYKKIFAIAKQFKILTILDCAQSFGIYPVTTEYVDFLVFAGHKSLYAMFGIAGYINIGEYNLGTYKVGGTGSDSLNLLMPENLPDRYEAGSLNAVGIYSVNKSIEYLQCNNCAEKKYNLVKYLIDKLSCLHQVKIYIPQSYIPKSIVSFNMDGFTSGELGNILGAEYGICVRTGYHCAPFVHKFIGSDKFNGTVRISFGIFNTTEEIDSLINALKEITV